MINIIKFIAKNLWCIYLGIYTASNNIPVFSYEFNILVAPLILLISLHDFINYLNEQR